jgi:hypothetical protein
MHLTGLLHDLGKVLAHPAFGAQPQWAVVGDTFPTGIAPEPCVVYHQLFEGNPDLQVRRRRRPGAGAGARAPPCCPALCSPAAPAGERAAARRSAGPGARPSARRRPRPCCCCALAAAQDPRFQGASGVYRPGCGLGAVRMSWGHDEYGYMVGRSLGLP